MINRTLFLIAALASIGRAFGQAGDSTDDNSFHLQTGVKYISNQSYVGRTDSVKLPVIIPSVNFQTPVGFYCKVNGYINLSENKTSFDGFGIEPGFEFSKNNWDGSISLIKNFISDSSNLITAPVKASMEFFLENTNKVITPSIGAEYMIGPEGNDLIVYSGISKLLTLTKVNKEPTVTLEPSLSLSGGTQNFYYSFLKSYAHNQRGKGKGRVQANGTQVPEATATSSRKFTALSMGIEVPLGVTSGKFEWKVTPAIERPLNLLNKKAGQSQSYVYVSTELAYTF